MYDQAGRQIALIDARPNRTTSTDAGAGNRLTKIDGGAPTTYTYNDASQLATEVAAKGTTTYTYDADGNQTLVVEPDSTRTTYTWTALNQIYYAYEGKESWRNLYDTHGLLRSRDNSPGEEETKFLWDGQNVLLEMDTSDVIQVVYNLEPQLYGNLVSQRRSGNTRFHQNDALGSTWNLTDASANITDSYLYKAFGEIVTCSGSSLNPFRYVGKHGDYYISSDLTYVRARWLSTALGRWLSQDPVRAFVAYGDNQLDFFGYLAKAITNRQGIPYPYTYCANRPPLIIDSSGMFWHILGGCLLQSHGSIWILAYELAWNGETTRASWCGLGANCVQGALTAGLGYGHLASHCIGGVAGALVSVICNGQLHFCELLDATLRALAGCEAGLLDEGILDQRSEKLLLSVLGLDFATINKACKEFRRCDSWSFLLQNTVPGMN